MLDGLESFLAQRFIQRRQFLRDKAIEFGLDVPQFFLQRFDPRHLVIGGTPLVKHQVAIKASGLFADALLAGDGSAFLGGDNFLAQLVNFLREVLQALREGCVALYFTAAIRQRVANAVDAVDVKAHVAEQIVNAHCRVQFELAVFKAELRAGIEVHHELSGVRLGSPGHLHRVGTRQNSRALRGFKRGSGRGRNPRRLDAHGPFDTADASAAVRRQGVHESTLRVKNLEFHLPKNMAFLLIVSNESGVRRIRPGEHGASVRPAAAGFQSLLRGLGGKENRLLAHDIGSQLSQRRDVVDDPYAAPMSGEHEVRFARMHHDVADGYAREIMALVLRPVLTAIQGNPQAKLRANIQNVLRNLILFDDMGVATHAAIGCNYGGPGLSVVGGLVDVWHHVAKSVAVKRCVSCCSVIKSSFDPRNPREFRQIRHIADDIRPGFAAILREL